MVRREDIEQLLNPHLNRLLLVAETALPPSQFQAFRKLALDEFGKNGFGRDLDRLFRQHLGTVRHGQE
jgi:hypothetical protein